MSPEPHTLSLNRPDPKTVVPVSWPERLCTRCVMDTSDPEIRFDANGVCQYCHEHDERVRARVLNGPAARQRLEAVVETIKREGRGKPYDCLIGVSGGVDSSWVAVLTRRLGLRPLAVHLDNGWNSEIAVGNIHRLLRALDIDLYTHVIDWEEFRDLQVAFLRASTPDAEVPTDHAIGALVFGTAARRGIRTIIPGYNTRSETHLSPAWSRGHLDWRYIRSIHRRFGGRPLRTYPHMGLLKRSLWQRRCRAFDILDLVDYSPASARRELERDFGWQSYGAKHCESFYTRFYQGYILLRKFGFDKRKCHLSSLVCAGEIARDEALAKLQEPPYPLDQQERDRVYVAKKLALSESEFDAIMALPPRSFWDYPSYERLLQRPLVARARALFQRVAGLATPASY